MLRNLKNECIIKFDLSTNGPLLIRDGKPSGLDPTIPDIQFIRSMHNGKMVPVMPGSSIKGVFRSRIERLLHNIDGCRCCDVFWKKSKDSERPNYNLQQPGKEKYKDICPACKMFGNLGIKGRVQFKDAFVKNDDYKLGQRTNVGIDRITGAAVKGALFDPEVLEEGTFHCEVKIENYFRWQLKLIAHVLEEVNVGYVTFGGATSRGFGNMSFNNFRIISKEYGNFEEGFYRTKEYNWDELKEILREVQINENVVKEVELDGQAI